MILNSPSNDAPLSIYQLQAKTLCTCEPTQLRTNSFRTKASGGPDEGTEARRGRVLLGAAGVAIVGRDPLSGFSGPPPPTPV
jgi:hypothetical protein